MSCSRHRISPEAWMYLSRRVTLVLPFFDRCEGANRAYTEFELCFAECRSSSRLRARSDSALQVEIHVRFVRAVRPQVPMESPIHAGTTAIVRFATVGPLGFLVHSKSQQLHQTVQRSTSRPVGVASGPIVPARDFANLRSSRVPPPVHHVVPK